MLSLAIATVSLCMEFQLLTTTPPLFYSFQKTQCLMMALPGYKYSLIVSSYSYAKLQTNK